MGGKSSIIGIVLGVGAVLASVLLEGGTLGSLVNIPAFVLVFGGTLGAMFTSHPLQDCVKAVKAIGLIIGFLPPDLGSTAAKFAEAGETARRDGLLALENQDYGDAFINQGLQMVTDGWEPELVENILLSLARAEQEEMQQAVGVYETLGSYSPTMGIIGTVVGLIHVLANLSDTEALGHSIASAFTATLYGIALANLICLPIGARIRNISQQIRQHREMMLEGVLSICQGDNPRVIEAKMATFQSDAVRRSEEDADAV